MLFRALQTKTGLMLGSLDDKAHHHRLHAAGVIEGVDLDVDLGIRLAAGIDFKKDGGAVLDLKHRVAPHVPIAVARMRVVGPLHRQSPALAEGVIYLGPNFGVGHIRQKGKLSFCDAHLTEPFLGCQAIKPHIWHRVHLTYMA